VRRLRERKHREGKPLAVMVADLATARALAAVADDEAAALASPQAPIVLVAKKRGDGIAPAVAPNHRRLGVMLPYTPLHHLLFDRLADHGVRALVMTSGNVSDEPICLENEEARRKLAGIADAWLLHDRPIVRRADDSVLQVLPDGPHFFRRSRGWAPVPVIMPGSAGAEVLAVGPYLKNTVCLLKEDRAFLSPHVGDLGNLEATAFFAETIATLEDVLECSPAVAAHDLHPGYFSTDWARKSGRETVAVQHHHAHLAAVLAEHGLDGPVIGLIMDGTGYGTDGTIWGGEVLVGDRRDFTRLGHLETVPLPGGDAAIRAPWRTAVSFMRQAYDCEPPRLPWMADRPVAQVMEMLERGVNSPPTSSCGRLFDAVAALTGRWPEAAYEAQAAIELMALTDLATVEAAGPLVEFGGFEGDPFVIPTGPIVRAVVAALEAGADAATIAARFHRTMIDLLAAAAGEARARSGLATVVLGGGVFLNEIMLQGTQARLADDGFAVHRPAAVPVSDGAVALGQAVVARARLAG
jgi:hydrogenase maturation protein HypF